MRYWEREKRANRKKEREIFHFKKNWHTVCKSFIREKVQTRKEIVVTPFEQAKE